MERGDEELLLWIMTHGRDKTTLAHSELHWQDIKIVLMSKGYVDRENLYNERGHKVYFVTSTGLYRLNQMQENEVNKLKEKQNERNAERQNPSRASY